MTASILPYFYSRWLLSKLMDNHESFRHVHCSFGKFIGDAREIVLQLPRSLGRDTQRNRDSRSPQRASKVWSCVIVHRLEGSIRNKSIYEWDSLEKNVVINPNYRKMFSHMFFHHMNTESAYVIKPDDALTKQTTSHYNQRGSTHRDCLNPRSRKTIIVTETVMIPQHPHILQFVLLAKVMGSDVFRQLRGFD